MDLDAANSFAGLGSTCTGMQGMHGPLEWISVQDMAQATELALAIAERAAGH